MSRIDDIFNRCTIDERDDEHIEVIDERDYCGCVFRYNDTITDGHYRDNIQHIRRLHYMLENSPFIEIHQMKCINGFGDNHKDPFKQWQKEQPFIVDVEMKPSPAIINKKKKLIRHSQVNKLKSELLVRFRFTETATEYDAMIFIFKYIVQCGMKLVKCTRFNKDWVECDTDEDELFGDSESVTLALKRLPMLVENNVSLISYVQDVLWLWGFYHIQLTEFKNELHEKVPKELIVSVIESIQIEIARMKFRKKGGIGFVYITSLRTSDAITTGRYVREFAIYAKTASELHIKVSELNTALEQLTKECNSCVIWKPFAENVRICRSLSSYIKMNFPQEAERYRTIPDRGYTMNMFGHMIANHCKPKDIHNYNQRELIETIVKYINSDELNNEIRKYL